MLSLSSGQVKDERPTIIPLVIPQINWTEYVTHANTVLGRSPTRSLDEHRVPVGDLFSFLASMGELQAQGTEPREYVRAAEEALQHLSFSFLIKTDAATTNRIMAFSALHYFASEQDSFFILTGTLKEWHTSIITCTHKRRAFKLRFFFDCMYLWFEQHGLREPFRLYEKKALQDGTFSLER